MTVPIHNPPPQPFPAPGGPWPRAATRTASRTPPSTGPTGRCYLHGKIADGLVQKVHSAPGRPNRDGGYNPKGSAHHRKN